MALQNYSKINCTIFPCEESTEDPIRSVSNIFNEIMPPKKSAVTFDIITVLNARDKDVKKMRLGMFLVYLKGEASIEVTPIGEEEFIKEKESKIFSNHTDLFSDTILEKITVKDHIFKYSGIYQIVALWLNEEETPETIMQEQSFPMEKMATSTTFKVSFSE